MGDESREYEKSLKNCNFLVHNFPYISRFAYTTNTDYFSQFKNRHHKNDAL